MNFQNIDTIDTCENTKGIIAVSTDPKVTVIAHPDDKKQGYVRVKFFEKETS